MSLLFFNFLFVSDVIFEAQAIVIKMDNSVDSDSNIDSIANKGTTSGSYLNAQAQDGTDQVITEESDEARRVIKGVRQEGNSLWVIDPINNTNLLQLNVSDGEYQELFESRAQTYHHFYNLSTGEYTFKNGYNVFKEEVLSRTNWISQKKYPVRFVVRSKSGEIIFCNSTELINLFSSYDNSSLWGVGIEGFGGVLGMYMNFDDSINGNGQYLYYPRLQNGSLPAYNFPLYQIYPRLVVRLLNDSLRYKFVVPTNEARNNIFVTNNSGILSLYYTFYNVEYYGKIFDFETGLKYNTSDHSFHMINNFRSRDGNFKDIGWCYEIDVTPQARETPFRLSKFFFANETMQVFANVSQIWNAGVILNDFYSYVEIVSENNETFRVDFQDMEQAGFNSKYLKLHDQKLPDGSIRRVLRVGMYDYGNYVANTLIQIDPIFSEKQETDSRDCDVGYLYPPEGVYYRNQLSWFTLGEGSDGEYGGLIAYDSGITVDIISTSNAELTFNVMMESLEINEYIQFGLYDKGDEDEYWDETEITADPEGAYTQSLYWSDSSFWSPTASGNITITDGKAGTLIDEWVEHHNGASASRQYIAIHMDKGTGIDYKTLDNVVVWESSTGTQANRPTLTFTYTIQVYNHRLEWEHQCQNVPSTLMDGFSLTIYGYSVDSEDFMIQLWNATSSAWVDTSYYIEQAEQWYNFTIDTFSGVVGSTITWRYKDDIVESDPIQTDLRIDYAGVTYWNYSINLIEGSISLPKYNATVGGWQNFIENPLVIEISSLYDYDVSIKGIDGTGSPVTNGYIRWDINSNPVAGVNLTTYYLVMFNGQSAGTDVQHQIWLFVAFPTLSGNEKNTYTFTLYVKVSKD